MESQDNRPKNNEDEYEKVCYVCRRPESRAGKLISMPGGLDICPDCMQKAFDSFKNSGLAYEDLMKMSSNLPHIYQVNMPKAAETEAEMPEENKENGGENPKENQEEESRKNQIPPMFQNIPVFEWNPFMDIPQKQRVKKKKKKEGEEKKPFDINSIPAPHKIKAMLDEYVVGQEQAKKAIAVAVYNHYKRVASDDSDGVQIEKSNLLMIGPTGSGKTYLVKTLAKLLDVPLAIADATSLTEAGYIGDDIESVISKLLAAADNDVERAEHGIVFIDEIDKIAKKKNTNTRDVSGESVQQELLKLLEGSLVEVPVGGGNKNMMVPTETVDTNNILFICGGAFPDLEDIIKDRLNHQSSMGFRAELSDKYDKDPNILSHVNMEDLRSFGMIPEFLGRLPVVVTLEPLSKEFLVKILTEPKNAIVKQYKKLLSMDEVDLEFEPAALEAIAQMAMEKKTGARALRAIIEEYMLDIMFEIPKDDNIGRVTITKEYLEKTGGPVIEMRGCPLLPKNE